MKCMINLNSSFFAEFQMLALNLFYVGIFFKDIGISINVDKCKESHFFQLLSTAKNLIGEKIISLKQEQTEP